MFRQLYWLWFVASCVTEPSSEPPISVPKDSYLSLPVGTPLQNLNEWLIPTSNILTLRRLELDGTGYVCTAFRMSGSKQRVSRLPSESSFEVLGPVNDAKIDGGQHSLATKAGWSLQVRQDQQFFGIQCLGADKKVPRSALKAFFSSPVFEYDEIELP